MNIPVIVVGPRGRRLGAPVCQALLAKQFPSLELVGVVTRPVGTVVSGRDPGEFGGVLNARMFLDLLPLPGPDRKEFLDQAVVFYAVTAESLSDRLREAAELGFRRHVIGTTGFSREDQGLIRDVAWPDAGRERLVVLAPNFSTGANMGAEQCATLACQLPEAEVEIIEAHHDQKADSPSGTALYWARAIAFARGQKPEAVIRCGRNQGKSSRDKGEIFIHSLRGGGVTGYHKATFFGPDDEIAVEHNARSSRLFAQGALTAIRWAGSYGLKTIEGGLTETEQAEMTRRSGVKYMRDVLDLKLLQKLGVH